MFQNNKIRIIASALAIVIFGFIFVNIFFLLDFLFQSAIIKIASFFFAIGPEANIFWLPPVMHGLFLILILFLSYLIFKTKLKTIYKAIFLVVPVAFLLATCGLSLYRWPILVYSISCALVVAALFYLYKTRQPWQYYFSIVFVALALLVMTIFGVEI